MSNAMQVVVECELLERKHCLYLALLAAYTLCFYVRKMQFKASEILHTFHLMFMCKCK